MNLNYKLRRFLAKKNQAKMASYNLAPQQLKCFRIVKRLIPQVDSTLLTTTETDKIYITNNKLDINVVISHDMVFLSNHKYPYYVSLPEEHIKEIYKRFNRRLEGERYKLEVEITKNVVDSLSNIEEELGIK